MTLRAKLWMAQLPLAVALVAVGAVAVAITSSLGASSRAILEDNYRSVLAAERMKEYVERIDSGALFVVAGERQRGLEQIDLFRGRFHEELEIQQGNLTEPGESEATERLRRKWEDYDAALLRLRETGAETKASRGLRPSEPRGVRPLNMAIESSPAGPIGEAEAPTRAGGELGAEHRTGPPETLRDSYFGDVLPRFAAVKQAAEVVLAMNQDAMMRKSEAGAAASVRFNATLVAIAGLGFVLGAWVSSRITRRLLRPLSVLSQGTRRIAEGDLSTSVPIMGSDEIAQVAAEFNTMAERLRAYRASSLGELIVARNAAQAAIDSLPDPILILSVDGHLLQANRSAQDHLTLDESPTEDPMMGMEPALRDRLRVIHRHVQGGRGPYVPAGLEEALRLPGAHGDRQLLPRGMPLYRDEGDVAGTALVLQDVTRLARFEQLRNDVVATVAHEFRTPLTSLRMAIHLCIEEAVGPLNDKQADLLVTAREDCERLQRVVDELLDLSRIREGRTDLRRESLDVEAMVQSAIDAQSGAAQQRGIQIRSEVLPGTGTVLADPDRIALVLANLIVNGVRHSSKGAEVSVRARPGDGEIRVEILDRGPGVPESERDAIFEKHVRGAGEPEGGSGLGLFIAREIVVAHGGTIGVADREGGGSNFWLTLPAAPDGAPPHSP